MIDLVKFPVTFPTLGHEIIQWCENYLCRGVGDVQGDPLEFDLEEYAWICWTYRLYPRDHPKAGRRMCHRSIYVRAKGCRKSELGGIICCAEALGPTRFDGWDAKGEPVGKPVIYPFVRIMSTEEGQSGNVFDNCSYIMQTGEVANAYAVDIGRSAQTSTRIFMKGPNGGVIVPSTSGDASKDGGKESHVAADETHLMNTNKLRTMYRTVARNTGKRIDAEPWIAEYSTAYQPGENSVLEQAAQKYAQLDYEEAVTEHGVLYDHRQGNPPKIFGQDASLAKAIRSAYGPKAEWTDIDKIVRVIRDAEDPETEAFRYYLSIPRAGSAQWLYPDEIKAVLGEVHPQEKERIALGFDGSAVDDHTALIGCREDGDLFTIGYWTPSPEEPRWREEVNEAVHWAFATYKPVRAYMDPPWWQEELNNWGRRYGSPPIVEFWTNIDTKMAVATGALRSAIRKENPEERITIDPFPLKTPEQTRDGMTLLAWHFTNARTRKVRLKLEDRAEEAFIPRKDRSGSANKIDSVPSAILARRARDDALKAGEFAVPTYQKAAF